MACKKVRVYLVLLLCSLMLAGCTVGNRSKEDEEENEKIVLKVFVWTDEAENIQILSNAYMERHHNIEIHVNSIPISEYRQRMLALKNGNEQADCIFTPSLAEAAVWENRNMLKNIESYLYGLEYEDYYGQWYQSGEERCASYMMPYRKSRWAVYYNKEIFDQKGVSYPKEDWTWEEYEEIAYQLSGWSNGKRVYGSLGFGIDNIWWRVPARTAGANNPFLKDDLDKFKQSVQWIYYLTYDLGAQAPYTKQVGSGPEYDADAQFLEGNTAMYFSGDWSVPVLNEAIKKQGLQIEYDIAPIPHWEGEESYTISDAALVSMLEMTKYPNEVFDYMQFVAGEEGARILAEHDLIPAWNAKDIYDIYIQSGEMPSHREYFFKEGRRSMVPASVKYLEGMEILKKEIALYLQQEQDIDKTFNNIEKALDSIR